MTKHLWEVEHPYYCEEGQYFSTQESRQTIWQFRSMAEFLAEMGEADKDYNYLFRWDWIEENDDGEPTYNGDNNYRNGKLKLFYMHQRKGYHSCSIVEVCRADEPAVLTFLRGHWEHMQTMWAPIAQTTEQKEPTNG